MVQRLTSRRYELRGRWLDPVMSLAAVVLLIVVFSVVIPRTTEADGRQYQIWVALALLVLSIHGVYRALKVPIAIETRDDGTITFESFIGRRSIPVSELESIKQLTLQPGYLMFMHSGGKLRTRHRFNDFYQFLSWVKQANPKVEIVGC